MWARHEKIIQFWEKTKNSLPFMTICITWNLNSRRLHTIVIFFAYLYWLPPQENAYERYKVNRSKMLPTKESFEQWNNQNWILCSSHKKAACIDYFDEQIHCFFLKKGYSISGIENNCSNTSHAHQRAFVNGSLCMFQNMIIITSVLCWSAYVIDQSS